MRKIVFSSVLILAIIAAVLVPACRGKFPTSPITLGGLDSDANFVLFTAENQNYFASNGIGFTFKTYDTGPDAIADLLNNKIDIAGASEYAMVSGAFANDNISIIASTSASYVIDLV